jgi:hypothetical protein
LFRGTKRNQQMPNRDRQVDIAVRRGVGFSHGLWLWKHLRVLETDIRCLRRYDSIAHEKIHDVYFV